MWRKVLNKTSKVPWWGWASLVATAVFWRLVWPLGVRVATDYHLIFGETWGELIRGPWVWSDAFATGLGVPAVRVMWAWPISSYLFGWGWRFWGEQGMTLVAGLAVPLILGFWGMGKLGEELGLSFWGKLVSGLFFFLNTYLVLLLDGGQVSLVMAYGAFPGVFYLLKRAVGGRVRDKLWGGVGLAILGWMDVRAVYLMGVLVGLALVFSLFSQLKWKVVGRYVTAGVVVGLVWVGLNAFWIWPTVSGQELTLPATYGRVSQVDWLSFVTLGNGMLWLQPHWYKNVFGALTQLKVSFVLLPILAWGALVLRKKDKAVAFWGVVAVGGLFLAKGGNEPLGGVYKWLFANLPGFSLFRDSSKWFFWVSLAYALLCGVTVEEVRKRLSDWTWGKRLAGMAIGIYAVGLMWPVWGGKMTGLFNLPDKLAEFNQLNRRLMEDGEFGRALWVGDKPPLVYFSPLHPALEGWRILEERVVAAGGVGTYETLNFLREAPQMGELLKVMGVRYIGYAYPDTRRVELSSDQKEYYETFAGQIEEALETKRQVIGGGDERINFYDLGEVPGRFWLADNLWWVVGGDDFLAEAAVEGEMNLVGNPMVFAEAKVGLGEKMEGAGPVGVILNRKGEVDVAVELLSGGNWIFPAATLNFEPDKTGWWKREAVDVVGWRSFLQQKYGLDNLDFDFGGGWAVAEKGSSKSEVQNLKLREKGVLLARVMESSRGGKVKIWEGGRLVGEIETKVAGEKEKLPNRTLEQEAEKANVRWFEVGEWQGDEEVVMETEGEINVVNALVVVDEREWEKAKEGAREMMGGGSVWKWPEEKRGLEAQLRQMGGWQEVKWERKDPTWYEVEMGRKGWLVFSEHYSPRWRLMEEEPLPAFDMVNVYQVTEGGKYEAKFAGQEKVREGMRVGGISLLAVGGGIWWARWDRLKKDETEN